jgi:hypothetical protein
MSQILNEEIDKINKEKERLIEKVKNYEANDKEKPQESMIIEVIQMSNLFLI